MRNIIATYRADHSLHRFLSIHMSKLMCATHRLGFFSEAAYASYSLDSNLATKAVMPQSGDQLPATRGPHALSVAHS